MQASEDLPSFVKIRFSLIQFESDAQFLFAPEFSRTCFYRRNPVHGVRHSANKSCQTKLILKNRSKIKQAHLKLGLTTQINAATSFKVLIGS